MTGLKRGDHIRVTAPDGTTTTYEIDGVSPLERPEGGVQLRLKPVASLPVKQAQEEARRVMAEHRSIWPIGRWPEPPRYAESLPEFEAEQARFADETLGPAWTGAMNDLPPPEPGSPMAEAYRRTLRRLAAGREQAKPFRTGLGDQEAP